MLELRNKMKNLYAEYDLYILPVIKYALALFSFLMINRALGYMDQLNNMVMLLILSAICAVLPWNAIPVIGVCMIILQCFALGLEVGACAVVLYLILLIFYYRFAPKDGLALILTSATAGMGFPGIVPIGLGLMRGPVSAFTAICSMISWFFIKVVTEVAAPMKYSPDSSVLDVARGIVDAMLNNRMLLVYAVVFGTVVLVVSLIRSSGISWGWEIAIVTGGILQIGLMVILSGLIGIETDMMSLLIGTVVAVLVSFVLAFFVYNVNYKGAERYQFEDDEYFYYVKAIPKNRGDERKAEGPDEEDDADEDA